MFQTLITQVMFALLLGTCVFAWWKGGPAERTGALFNGVICLGVIVFQALSHRAFHNLPFLIADGVLATGFLILAFRYASLWLAAAMLLQAVMFSFHAALLIGLLAESDIYYYYASINVLSYLVLIVIATGTFGAWMRRRRDARLKPSA